MAREDSELFHLLSSIYSTIKDTGFYETDTFQTPDGEYNILCPSCYSHGTLRATLVGDDPPESHETKYFVYNISCPSCRLVIERGIIPGNLLTGGTPSESELEEFYREQKGEHAVSVTLGSGYRVVAGLYGDELSRLGMSVLKGRVEASLYAVIDSGEKKRLTGAFHPYSSFTIEGMFSRLSILSEKKNEWLSKENMVILKIEPRESKTLYSLSCLEPDIFRDLLVLDKSSWEEARLLREFLDGRAW